MIGLNAPETYGEPPLKWQRHVFRVGFDTGEVVSFDCPRCNTKGLYKPEYPLRNLTCSNTACSVKVFSILRGELDV